MLTELEVAQPAELGILFHFVCFIIPFLLPLVASLSLPPLKKFLYLQPKGFRFIREPTHAEAREQREKEST